MDPRRANQVQSGVAAVKEDPQVFGNKEGHQGCKVRGGQ